MILKTFSVYDSKAEAYIVPFYTTTTALAIRMFESASNNAEHDFSKYAADYTLFETGTWDPQTGHHADLPAAVNLGSALTFQHPNVTRIEKSA